MSYDFFKEVFDHSPYPQAVVNGNDTYQIIHANTSFKEHFRLNLPGDSLPTIDEIYTRIGADAEQIRSALRKVLKEGTSVSVITGTDLGFFNVAADNTYPFFEITASPIVRQSESLVLLTIKDGNSGILKTRNGILRHVIDRLPFGLAAQELDTGKSIYVSPAYASIFGWDREIFTDPERVFSSIFPDPEEKDRMLREVSEAIYAGDPEKMLWPNLPITTQTGVIKRISISAIPLPGLNMVLTVVSDVTPLYNQLKVSEDLWHLLNSIINSTDDHIWAVGTQSELLTSNRAFSDFFAGVTGKGRPKPGEKLDTSSMPASLIQKWDDYYSRAFTGETINLIEEGWNQETQTPEYGEVTLNPMYDASGVLMGVAGFSKNITEQIAARKELERAKEELEKILDTSVDIICTADADGRYVKVSKAVEELWGYKPSEVEGILYNEFVHPDYQHVSREVADALAKGEAIGEFENVIVRKDGTLIHMLWTATWDTASELMYCVARDATDRRRALEAADAERHRYEKIFKNAPAFICALTLEKDELVFQMANNEFQRLFKRRNPVGQKMLEVFPEIGETEIVHIVNQVVNTGSTFEAGEMPLTLQDPEGKIKKEFFLSFVISPNKDQNGAIKGVFVFGIDMTDQVIARNELQEANLRYTNVANATFDAIWDWVPDGEIIYWGAGFESNFGHQLINGQSSISFWEELIHPSERQKVVDTLTRAYNSGSDNWSAEYRFRKADGSYAFVIDKGVVLKDEAGNPVRMIGAMQDITLLKQLEDLLSRTSAMARIGAWEYYPKSGKVTFSEVLCNLLGIETDSEHELSFLIELFGKQNDKYLLQERLINAAEKGNGWDEEVEIRTLKGESIWVRSRGECEVVDGTCHAIYASIQDINEPKLNQLRLAEAYEENTHLLESIGDAFFAIDENAVVTYWNRMAEILTGVSRDQLIGKSFFEAYPFEVNDLYTAKWSELREKGGKINFEAYNPRVEAWQEYTAYKSKKGYSVFFRDITDRKLAEEQLKELNATLTMQTEALSRSNKELEQFAYVASHDLQEPLRMVTGFLSQLEKKYSDNLDDNARKYIHYAVDGAARMRYIILDLLEYSRVGSVNKALVEVNLEQVLEEVKDMLKSELESSGTKITTGKMPVLKTQKGALLRVLQNLLGNAVKYRHPERKPELTIEAVDQGTQWQLSVSDNGIGIGSNYFERIFEMFQRLHSREKYPGTGMGLALARKIIEHLGGKIWVESVEGEGSTFYFTIPK